MELNDHGYVELETIIFVVIFGLIFLCFLGGIADYIDDYRHSPDIIALGYDINDVQVFLKGTSFDNRDFLNSQGLRKEYEAYADGIKTGFMENARLKKEKDNAADLGFFTGMAVGSLSGRR